MTISPAEQEHSEAIYGLLPDTTHCYKIYAQNSDETKVYKAAEGMFKTLKPRDQTKFGFIAVGDSDSGSEEQIQLARQMAKFDPELVIHTGDLVETGLDADADLTYFQPFKPLLRKAPFFIALGNHEYSTKCRKPGYENFPQKNYMPFHSMPSSPKSPNYYLFDTANARFICLDTNSAENCPSAPSLAKGSNQLNWLKQALSDTKAQWKFVYMHHPVYASGGHGSTPGFDLILAPLFEKYKVDIVFQGHDHNYERTFPIKNGITSPSEGVTYVTVGGGGSPLYIQRSHPEWSEKFISAYSFAYVEIDGKYLSMTAYNRQMQAIDTLQIRKN